MVYLLNRLTNKQASAVDPGVGIGDPLQHLIACHDRIEERLQILERVIPYLRSDLEEKRREARQALDKALEFLEAMGTLHSQDEEDSVFPRLLVKAGDDGPDARELIAMLETQHREKEEVLAKLKAYVIGLPVAPDSPVQAQVDRLEGFAAHLGDLYRPHIMIENQRLIPMAEEHLKTGDREEILHEMRSRRGL